MPEICVQNEIIPYHVVRNPRARRTIISLAEDGVRLTVPKREALRDAVGFLESHGGWVLDEYRKILERRERLSRQIESGDGIPYLGYNYPLVIVDGSEKRTKVEFTGKRFIARLADSENGESRERIIRSNLQSWYRAAARRIITQRANLIAGVIDVSFGRITIRDQKTLWGSCSNKRTLSFNWRLVLIPLDMLDYIIVHELCHLVCLRHSQRFWKLVQRWVPDYAGREKWIRDNEASLWL